MVVVVLDVVVVGSSVVVVDEVVVVGIRVVEVVEVVVDEVDVVVVEEEVVELDVVVVLPLPGGHTSAARSSQTPASHKSIRPASLSAATISRS